MYNLLLDYNKTILQNAIYTLQEKNIFFTLNLFIMLILSEYKNRQNEGRYKITLTRGCLKKRHIACAFFLLLLIFNIIYRFHLYMMFLVFFPHFLLCLYTIIISRPLVLLFLTFFIKFLLVNSIK